MFVVLLWLNVYSYADTFRNFLIAKTFLWKILPLKFFWSYCITRHNNIIQTATEKPGAIEEMVHPHVIYFIVLDCYCLVIAHNLIFVFYKISKSGKTSKLVKRKESVREHNLPKIDDEQQSKVFVVDDCCENQKNSSPPGAPGWFIDFFYIYIYISMHLLVSHLSHFLPTVWNVCARNCLLVCKSV